MLPNPSMPSHRITGLETVIRATAKTADRYLGPRGCLFTFHRASSSWSWGSLPNRNFYLDLEFLDKLLSYLKRTGWSIVTMDEVLERTTSADNSGPYVNFSVDDCYRDTFEKVVPMFRKHGVPVTLFVTTGIPDGSLPMWGAGLEDTLLKRDRITFDDNIIQVGAPEAKRAAFGLVAAAWDGPQAAKCYADFCVRNGVDASELHRKHAISWDMLEELRDDPRVEIGAHTINHLRISAISSNDALAELAGSRERLKTKLKIDVRHFAFPYGRSNDCSIRDFDLARRAGFASAATTRKGVVRRNQHAFSLPRNTLNGKHRNLTVIELHLTGVSGAAARLLGRV